MVDLSAEVRADTLLFGESQSRIILSCSRENIAKIETLAKQNDLDFSVIGQVGGNSFEIKGFISQSVNKLVDVWGKAIMNSLVL